jgi:hypothetical protein
MPDWAQLGSIGVALGLVAGGGWVMYDLLGFGLVGAGLLVVFLLPVVAVVAYLTGGGDGGAQATPSTYESKGARSSGRDGGE